MVRHPRRRWASITLIPPPPTAWFYTVKNPNFEVGVISNAMLLAFVWNVRRFLCLLHGSKCDIEDAPAGGEAFPVRSVSREDYRRSGDEVASASAGPAWCTGEEHRRRRDRRWIQYLVWRGKVFQARVVYSSHAQPRHRRRHGHVQLARNLQEPRDSRPFGLAQEGYRALQQVYLQQGTTARNMPLSMLTTSYRLFYILVGGVHRWLGLPRTHSWRLDWHHLHLPDRG